MYQNTLLLLRSPERRSGPVPRVDEKGVTMAFWSWLDVPFAVLVLAAARGVPLWLERKNESSLLTAGPDPRLAALGLRGLAEWDERLAEPGCLADRRDPQDWVMPELAPCPQCGLPAEIRESFCLDSTDGPVEHVVLSCVDAHHFRMAANQLAAAPLAHSCQVDAVGPGRRTSGPPMTW
jgi:hypothetical protein